MDEARGLLSELLSLKASNSQINSALDRLRGLLAAVALDGSENNSGKSTSLQAFLHAQDSFLDNVAARLVDFLARCLLRLQHHKYGDDYQAIFAQLGQTMQLMQGFLLLHGPSRRLFATPCNMELLITCLTLPDHSTPAATSTSTGTSTPSLLSESTASASPRLSSTQFDFARSTFGSSRLDVEDCPAQPTLAELTLETLLCALVDSAENVKVFEACNGIAEISRLIRGKVDAGKAAKIKCLEFLYFWLYPETGGPVRAKMPTSSRRPCEPASRPPTAPSTPQRERMLSRVQGASTSSSGMTRTPTETRLRAMLESTHDTWTPSTPSKPSRTFERTHLALSRSAAAQSPRKRSLATTYAPSGLTDENTGQEMYESPRAKRSQLASSESPVRVARQRTSPGLRRQSILGAASARSSSTYNAARVSPIAQKDPFTKRARSSMSGNSEDPASPFKAPAKVLWSPSLSERPFSAPPAAPPAGDSPGPAPLRRVLGSPSALGRSALMSRDPMSSSGYGLPESTSQTKGLFAPHYSPGIAQARLPSKEVESPIVSALEDEDTCERRKQLLGQHLGNLDQLLHRFEVLRCR